jgi:hypothetical protein
MTTEAAECERLAESVKALLPALEQFNRFDGPDLAGPQRARWRDCSISLYPNAVKASRL